LQLYAISSSGVPGPIRGCVASDQKIGRSEKSISGAIFAPVHPVVYPLTCRRLVHWMRSRNWPLAKVFACPARTLG